jgi:two-component system sensor histidine kinase KdpD
MDVPQEVSPAGALERRRRVLPLPRLVAGWTLALVGAPALTAILLGPRDRLGLSSILLLFLVLVVAVAALGGAWPSLFAAVGSVLLVNWFFTPPFHTLSIQHTHNVLALVVFVLVAVIVSTLVSTAARRSRQAMRARAEAEIIAKTAVTLLGSHDPLVDLLALLRTTLGLEAAALLRESSSGWRVVAHVGTPCPNTPGAADRALTLADGTSLAMVGRSMVHTDERLLDVFGAQMVAAMRAGDLRAEARAARELAEANELRAALLDGVSHDLRTPLSSIKASVTSLLQEEIDWSEDATNEFLQTIDAETDRLNNLVGNLLDMSRLRTGSLRPTMREVAVDEVVGLSLASLGERAHAIAVEVPETLPFVRADPALLERSLANLLDNALKHAPGSPAVVVGEAHDGEVSISVVDRGPGIPVEERERAFEPFQRLGDGTNRSGVGLGLAVTRGFVDAMGGRLTLEDSPDGGVTARIDLPAARS